MSACLKSTHTLQQSVCKHVSNNMHCIALTNHTRNHHHQKRFVSSASVDEHYKGFDLESAKYERGRPTYPKIATDYLLDLKNSVTTNCNNTNINDISLLEIGAGTGKFTDILVSPNYFPDFPLKLIEPTQSFRAILSQKYAQHSNIEILDGFADNMPMIESNSTSIVFCAQCFHWFASNQTLQEFQRVLRQHNHDNDNGQKSKSHLLLIWNVMDHNANDFVHGLHIDIIEQYFNENSCSVRFIDHQQTILEMFSEQYLRANALLFEPVDKYIEFANAHAQIGDYQMVVDRVLSISSFSVLDEVQKHKITDEIKHLVIKHYGTLDTNKVNIPYSTFILHTQF